ncbi:MAG: hypothetical protein OET55_10480 [Desulfuromonadales bacterium]|jgi:hypothetical protein|nr:hypothetical protein [Desulfuromonadales bacterium]MDH3961679.1 hypothetical protein [Desulfuromonadales bacterium]
MLTKNLLIGMLTFFFCLGLAGTVFAGDSNEPYASLTESDDIDSNTSLSPYMDSVIIESRGSASTGCTMYC